MYYPEVYTGRLRSRSNSDIHATCRMKSETIHESSRDIKAVERRIYQGGKVTTAVYLECQAGFPTTFGSRCTCTPGRLFSFPPASEVFLLTEGKKSIIIFLTVDKKTVSQSTQ